jgi:hypothetical protein
MREGENARRGATSISTPGCNGTRSRQHRAAQTTGSPSASPETPSSAPPNASIPPPRQRALVRRTAGHQLSNETAAGCPKSHRNRPQRQQLHPHQPTANLNPTIAVTPTSPKQQRRDRALTGYGGGATKPTTQSASGETSSSTAQSKAPHQTTAGDYVTIRRPTPRHTLLRRRLRTERPRATPLCPWR